MKLLFADETSDQKFKDYFGICVAVIDASKYSLIKKAFNKTLTLYGWDPTIEFKGSLLFSETKGDPTVSVENRVEMAYELLKLNVSEKNSRISFHYVATNADPAQFDTVYISSIEKLIKKSLKPVQQASSGKDLVAVTLDERSGINKKKVRETVTNAVADRGYVLFEDVIYAESRMETVGTIYADLVAYLVSRIDVIENDADFFRNEEVIDPSNGKWRKLQSSRRLIEVVKRMSREDMST